MILHEDVTVNRWPSSNEEWRENPNQVVIQWTDELEGNAETQSITIVNPWQAEKHNFDIEGAFVPVHRTTSVEGDDEGFLVKEEDMLRISSYYEDLKADQRRGLTKRKTPVGRATPQKQCSYNDFCNRPDCPHFHTNGKQRPGIISRDDDKCSNGVCKFTHTKGLERPGLTRKDPDKVQEHVQVVEEKSEDLKRTEVTEKPERLVGKETLSAEEQERALRDSASKNRTKTTTRKSQSESQEAARDTPAPPPPSKEEDESSKCGLIIAGLAVLSGLLALLKCVMQRNVSRSWW